MALDKRILYYGTTESPVDWRALRAGPLTLCLDGADLRYISLGDREIVRRVYVALRDSQWDTVPAALSNWQVEIRPQSFAISFAAEHVTEDVDFCWRGSIVGGADGSISYTMDGVARRTFLRARVGFCILHPIRECAGQPLEAIRADGSVASLVFPADISPYQPAKDLVGISHQVAPGLKARIDLTGEVFEMEDQRNWTDASFKTYGTPLVLPWPGPVEVRVGERVSQSFRLTLHGPAPVAKRCSGRLAVRLDPNSRMLLPHVGLGSASHGQKLSEREIARLDALHLSHLRVDLDLAAPEYEAGLARAADEARRLGASLEATLFLSSTGRKELVHLRQVVERISPKVSSWLIVPKKERITTEAWLRLARETLRSYDTTARFGAGTNHDFVAINRVRPPAEAADFVFFSINPQVHAFDNASVVESLEMQGSTIASGRKFAAGKPLVVSPVTLRPRFNTNVPITAEDKPAALPWSVDPRQMSLFGACWTVGSIKYLAEAGAHSMTYFETTGWRGIMETEWGSELPDQFHSMPGMLFPVYHVLADVGEMVGGEVIRSVSSDTLAVECLALQREGRTRVLACNLGAEERDVTIQDISGESALLRRLNENTVQQAMLGGVQFRDQQDEIVAVTEHCLRLHLLPFEVARIDC